MGLRHQGRAPLSGREQRLGQNEVLYREVNERVRELQQSFGTPDDQVTFVCECSLLECSEQIALTIAEYERVRSDPRRFALKPGHEVPDVEIVVERNDRFEVIQKREGDPAELAEAEDPRAD